MKPILHKLKRKCTLLGIEWQGIRICIDQKSFFSSYKIGAEKPLIPLINSKNVSCINPAYMEFPSDIFSQRARARGAILLHIAIVCYMFYCLAVVCDHYFLPSLEECCLVSVNQLIKFYSTM